MILFKLTARLEAAEKNIAELQAALARTPPVCKRGEKEDRPPAFKLDDQKMQEGIANLMGYDPFGQKRSDVE